MTAPEVEHSVGTKQRYLVALGSNLGELENNLKLAVEKIRCEIGSVLAVATPFANPPLGAADKWFLNSAAIVACELSPICMLGKLLAIERSMGRERDVRWGNRVIDLDIILWRDENGKSRSFNTSSLKIPHPCCLERDFVMVPACEIAGAWLHPVCEKNLVTLWTLQDTTTRY